MSYDIYIGNAEPTELDEDDGEYRCACNGVCVAGVALPDAPSFPFDRMTANGNSRHPGYSQWAEFCDTARLHDLFHGKESGLMRQHPGTFALSREHLATVRSRREEWQARHPDAIPGWDWSIPQLDGDDDGVRGRDHILARLLWLEWWMDWALTNCERPAIHNH